MRNLLRRTSLLVAAVLLATALLSSDFSAKPAGATTLYRRSVTHHSARRWIRPYRFRASRSAFRALAVPAGDVWARLRGCESGGRYTTNTGNGFFGGLQFEPGTWRAYGGELFALSAHMATRDQQIAVAERVLTAQGWLAWPACSAKLGLR